MNYFRPLPETGAKPSLPNWKSWTKAGPTLRTVQTAKSARTYRTQLLRLRGGYEWRLLGCMGDMGGKGWSKTVEMARKDADSMRQAILQADNERGNT